MSEKTTPPSDGTGQFSMGKLTREKFDSAQDFANEIARMLIGAPPQNGSQSGVRISKQTSVIVVSSGATFVDLGYDASDSIINLINKVDASPTISIRAISGQRVIFSGTIPNSNYSLSITKISVL